MHKLWNENGTWVRAFSNEWNLAHSWRCIWWVQCKVDGKKCTTFPTFPLLISFRSLINNREITSIYIIYNEFAVTRIFYKFLHKSLISSESFPSVYCCLASCRHRGLLSDSTTYEVEVSLEMFDLELSPTLTK